MVPDGGPTGPAGRTQSPSPTPTDSEKDPEIPQSDPLYKEVEKLALTTDPSAIPALLRIAGERNIYIPQRACKFEIVERIARDFGHLYEQGYRCKVYEESVPQHLCCPITRQLFVDPVVASDGFTYERSSIVNERVSPMTREPLSHPIIPLQSTIYVRQLVTEWIERNPHHAENPNTLPGDTLPQRLFEEQAVAYLAVRRYIAETQRSGSALCPSQTQHGTG